MVSFLKQNCQPYRKKIFILHIITLSKTLWFISNTHTSNMQWITRLQAFFWFSNARVKHVQTVSCASVEHTWQLIFCLQQLNLRNCITSSKPQTKMRLNSKSLRYIKSHQNCRNQKQIEAFFTRCIQPQKGL